MAAFFGLEHTVLTLLLDKGVELSRLEPKLGSALLVSSAKGDCSLVRLQLDNNANANATSWLDYTPLHLAVQQGHLAIARLLLDADADVTRRCSSNAYTALHIAARNGYETIVQVLLNGGQQRRHNVGLGYLAAFSCRARACANSPNVPGSRCQCQCGVPHRYYSATSGCEN